MVAFARRPKLREDVFTTSSELRIDEEAGIISGFKMCGLRSDNGRDYLPAALKEAIPLYIGKPAYLNHLNEGETRDVHDDLGYWVHVELREDGLYGDLKYEKSHPYAPRLVERAKTMPKNIGFSHDADTDSEFIEVREGRPTITKITVVNSVDLVAKPATTSGLNEGKTVAKTTVRALLENVKTTKARQAWLNRLLEEDDGAMAPLTAEVDEPADPKDAMSDAFRAGLHATVDGYCDGKLDLVQFTAQVKDLAKTHDKMTAKDEPEAPTAEAEDEPADDKKDDEEKDDMKEQLRVLRAEIDVRNLCESLDIKPNKQDLQDLIEESNLAKRARLAERIKAAQKPDGKARSRGTTSVNESTDTVDDLKKKYRIVG